MSKSVNENAMKLNRIKPGTNVLFNILFVILALMCFVPIILIFVISITDNSVIRQQGYQFFVWGDQVSFSAYEYLWDPARHHLERSVGVRVCHGHRHGSGCGSDYADGLCSVPPGVQAERLFDHGGVYPHDLQRRYGGKLCGQYPDAASAGYHVDFDSAPVRVLL